ncbi:hypothetical protein H7X46_14090 [Pseudonocardia sp. C8]|uniref:hypothetical protein n=1 Tax=Pseudonocardia sp. C8 TaxID=2762759 RepID=UPI001642D19A|nr:hypothetical protein [Pseudonocardia sp. C8]MBC3192192.1 hypothetical protein [Pseudonocardia sp. C8]
MQEQESMNRRIQWARPGLLGRLSKGSTGKAALILVAAHLLLLLVCLGIWYAGLAPVFDRAHWIPAVLVTVVAVAGGTFLMASFGFWGVGAHSGQDGGDQFEGDFSPAAAFGLGWLRWALQIVVIGSVGMLVILTWMNFRPWYILSSPGIDAMPTQVAGMPIPRDWEQSDTEKDDDWKRDRAAYTKPHARYEQSYYAPVRTFAEMERWVSDEAAWKQSRFGAITNVDCDERIERCRADKVPAAGEPEEHFIEVYFSELDGVTDSSDGSPLNSVRVVLYYAEDGQEWN